MKFDVVSFLGGLTAGAAGAALLELANSRKLLGQGVVTGGPGGGFGGGSYGPGGGGSYAPGGAAGVVMGPGGSAFTNIAPSMEEFAPWFWPLNVFPIYQQPILPPPPQSMVCKKIKDEDDQETFVCDRRYPVQPVAWGPPAGWL